MSSAKITLLDGGMGKTLQANGAPFRQPEWSALALMEAPAEVTTAHEQFVAAGADVITTNNYAVVPFHIGERFETEGARLTTLSASLARGAAGPGTLVAGSIPPLYGSYQPELFNPQTAAADVDLFICETQSSTEEATASVRAAERHGKPIWISYTLEDDSPDTSVLRSGETLERAIGTAGELGAEAVLFNCSQPEIVSAAIPLAVQCGDGMTIGGFANTFVPKPEEYAANEVLLGHRADLDPAGYLSFVEGWISAGATIVGGCCGVMPAHTSTMRAYLDR